HEHVGQPAVLQVRQAREPELRALAVVEPQPQQLLVTLEVNAQRDVQGVLADSPTLAADVNHDAVEVDDGPDGTQPARPPGGDLFVQAGDNLADQGRGDLDAIQLGDDVLDVARGQPLGVQSQDLLVEAGQAALVLADDDRLEGAVAVA